MRGVGTTMAPILPDDHSGMRTDFIDKFLHFLCRVQAVPRTVQDENRAFDISRKTLEVEVFFHVGPSFADRMHAEEGAHLKLHIQGDPGEIPEVVEAAHGYHTAHSGLMGRRPASKPSTATLAEEADPFRIDFLSRL